MASEPQGRPPDLGVDDDEVAEQRGLPVDHGLARPGLEPHRERTYCPYDGTDVTSTLRGHHVDGRHLVDDRLDDVDTAPVYGYRCPYCSTVLALDPSSRVVELPGPDTGCDGWVAVDAQLDDHHGAVLVPWGVVRP